MNIPVAPRPGRPALSIAATSLAGALVMLVGLAWLFSNLGLFDGWTARAVGIWPVILILLGLSNVLGPRRHRSVVGVLLMAAGSWLFAIEQGWLQVPFWTVFAPTAVTIVGASIIWHAYRRGPLNARVPGAPEVPPEAFLRIFSLFSGSELRPALPFEGAQLSAVMGGVKLDLSRTPMAQPQASIDVFLLMGGAEIIVPPDWEVTAAPLAIMGGVSDKRSSLMPPTRRLFINGGVFMGGIEIKD